GEAPKKKEGAGTDDDRKGDAAHPHAAGDKDHPVKPELQGEKSVKAAKQAEASEQQASAGQVVQHVAQMIGAWFSSFVGGAAKEGDPNKMSDADSKQMAQNVDSLSTKADCQTDPGAPPQVEMTAEAQGQTKQDRADLETKLGGAETTAHADCAQPMG